MAEYIVELVELAQEAEKIKGYWDDTGLDMHIAVKKDGQVAVSTKHWGRVHYIKTGMSTGEAWEKMHEISNLVGRKLIKSKKGRYVYIHKLSLEQTQRIFDFMKDKFGHDVQKKMERSWKIKDAVLP